MRGDLHKLEQEIGYKFKDFSLLVHAMRHSSYINERHWEKSVFRPGAIINSGMNSCKSVLENGVDVAGPRIRCFVSPCTFTYPKYAWEFVIWQSKGLEKKTAQIFKLSGE